MGRCAPSFACLDFGMLNWNTHLPQHSLRSLPLQSRGANGGLRGEGSEAAGSPLSYTASLDFWLKGP